MDKLTKKIVMLILALFFMGCDFYEEFGLICSEPGDDRNFQIIYQGNQKALVRRSSVSGDIEIRELEPVLMIEEEGRFFWNLDGNTNYPFIINRVSLEYEILDFTKDESNQLLRKGNCSKVNPDVIRGAIEDNNKKEIEKRKI